MGSPFENNGVPLMPGPAPGVGKQTRTVHSAVFGIGIGLETIPGVELHVGEDEVTVLSFFMPGEQISFILSPEAKEGLVRTLTGGIVLP